MTEPSVAFEKLVAFVAGELDPAAQAEMERRIAASPPMAATVARLRMVLETQRADDSVAASASALERGKALLQERPVGDRSPHSSVSSLLDALKRTVAELIYDSRPQLALAGVRGGATSYQLAFESEPADVDLDVEPDGARRQVYGQLTLHTPARATRVTFATPGTADSIVSVEPDEDGVFSVATECGTFDVLIALPDTVVVLPNVEIE